MLRRKPNYVHDHFKKLEAEDGQRRQTYRGGNKDNYICRPCGRGAVVERTPSVTKVVSSILAQSERDFVGGRERTL